MFRAILVSAALCSSLVFAGAKTYQVTGPVLEVKDDVVVVQKGKDKWEMNKAQAKTEGGELKVGSKITITYTMTAESIEVKPEKKK
jgi:hypothetical protein